MINRNANEELPYTLKNNYMFLALMNSDENSLKLLISATLDIKYDDIKSVEINNPIEIGKAVEDKTFILDVNVTLNNDTILDIELQIRDYHNWPERSLSYMCRTYDTLRHGQDYIDSKTVINISILDYTLFPEYPEFYSEYMILNTKNHNVYTSKFRLYVLDLTKEELATEEDVTSGRTIWTKIFKAKKWGDLMKVMSECEEYSSVVESVDTLSNNRDVLYQCRTLADEKEDFRYFVRWANNKIDKLNTEMKEKDIIIAEKDAEKEAILAEKDAEIAALKEQLRRIKE
jgi:predicted transposase/invertase (TIGR01784 family)